MNRNRDDEMRRNEGRWDPRMNERQRMNEWNERGFGEDIGDREFGGGREYRGEQGYGGHGGGYGGYGEFRGGRGMQRDFERSDRDYDRDRFERERGMGMERYGGYGGYGNERYGEMNRGYGEMNRGYGEMNRGYGERGWRGGEERGQWSRQRMGRGPKNYTRTDERIREDLCDRLSQHDWIDSSEVDVQVHNGEITLTGTVEERQAKHMIEDMAESIFGAKDVHNQIRVQHGDHGQQQQSRTQQPSKTPKA